MTTITPFLWFDNTLEEAIAFYRTVFDRVEVTEEQRYPEGSPGPAGALMTASFEIEGQRFTGLNGGPQFPFTEAVSFFVGCDSQDQADSYWDKLAERGRPGQCGWVADRFGLWWQIVPPGLMELIGDSDAEAAARAMQAMLGQSRLDIAEIRRAHAGD
jgi:predicted 3-demethylubiquinone-9 3-methyltransferase (glyoxalase superfamily)